MGKRRPRAARDGDGTGGRSPSFMAGALAIVAMVIAVGLRHKPSPTALVDPGGGDTAAVDDDVESAPSTPEPGIKPPLPALPDEIGGLSPTRVRTMAWTDTTDISKLLTRLDAVPLILTGSPTKLWPARLWTPAALAELSEVLPSVHEHWGRRFLYFDGTKPLAKQDSKLQPPFRCTHFLLRAPSLLVARNVTRIIVNP